MTSQFSGADLSDIDVSQPLSGELPWPNDEDDWVDVYAYSTPILLGTFPVVNGKVQLTGVDLSALEAGKHRLAFIGQTSGATSVAAFAITEAAEEGSRLAASGATDALPIGDQGTIVFGWVFASHQIGAAIASLTAGVIRNTLGTYTYAWWGGAALCAIAAVLSIVVRRQRAPVSTP